APRPRPDIRRAVRAPRRPPRDRQRVLRAERPGRPAGALRRPARRAGRRGRGGPRDGRRLRARAGIRHAADCRSRNRHRPSGHAAHRGHLDPRGDPLPTAAPGAPAMSWELMVGVRSLRSRRRAFLSLISALSLAGVTIGVATLLIVLAVMTGLESELRQKILGFNPHITLANYTGGLEDWRDVATKVREQPGVVAAAPVIYGQAML